MTKTKQHFDNWNIEKQNAHFDKQRPFYHEREIWWCSLGINIGSEQDGTGKNYDRPVIIIKGFNRDVFLAAALTGKRRDGKYYFYLGKIEGRDATAVLSQIRLVDAKRLVRKITTIDKELFAKLKSALQAVIFG